MELEEMAEPDWFAEAFEARSAAPVDAPIDWSSDYPISMNEDPYWVDAYEL